MKQASCKLENELFGSVYDKTPEYIRNSKLMDFSKRDEFVFTLKREHLYPYDSATNPEGLNLLEWFSGYSKEARVSTAGIRGPQNILFPQDTRFPINLAGIVLAALAKAAVIKEKYPDKQIIKLAGCEVRYNSQLYLDAIARIQAARGIRTLLPSGRGSIPIWLASFLIFKLDLAGGEYITSSHGISVKTATKDLNSQGSQYLPEESMEFVNKIQMIFDKVQEEGSYPIRISSKADPLIDEKVMTNLEDGLDLYIDYLKTGVAEDLSCIRGIKNMIVIECVGGCAYRTLSRVLNKLGIFEKYAWNNTEEDPFFHSIGKYDTDPNGNKVFYDYSVDASLSIIKPGGQKFFPVINSLHYEDVLKCYPDGTAVLITDPDHDRLTVCQLESADNIAFLDRYGISYMKLDNRVLAIYSANQAFLMLMDFRAKQLKRAGKWGNHSRFIIKTTASSLSWDEWAKANDVGIINVPVGFKEIANVMKKAERKLRIHPTEAVVTDDIFGNAVDIGIQPRLLFAGEESGGMIMGSEELIESLSGRQALAMREKSAAEAIIAASSLIAELEKDSKTLSEYLANIFISCSIKSIYDTRVDIAYYNESEPDIVKFKESKTKGEVLRTQNDLFFLSIAIAKRKGVIGMDEIISILNDVFPELDFSDLIDVLFTGDGTYFRFRGKYIEIRPSGTDAKTKVYGGGVSLNDITKYSKILGNYSGARTELHKKYISESLYNTAKEIAAGEYLRFAEKDADKEVFTIPEYRF